MNGCSAVTVDKSIQVIGRPPFYGDVCDVLIDAAAHNRLRGQVFNFD